ncbi:DNA cytosine methyltransferase [Trichormus sp. NMC-1]|nr:DNA cytosine methyltransferase [Trichormus sp. NMC-1]
MEKFKLKFADLFAGIGGFRLGFEKAGYDCVSRLTEKFKGM